MTAITVSIQELGIERLLLKGGGSSNGSFLRAGLIDEISLDVCPAVDGARGGPYAADSLEDESDAPAPLRSITLESCEILQGARCGCATGCRTADARAANPPKQNAPPRAKREPIAVRL